MMRSIPLVLVLFLSLLQVACRRATDTGDPSDVAAANEWIWTDTIGISDINLAHDPARGLIYAVTTDREVIAVTSSTGAVVWRRKYWRGYPVGSNIAVAGGVVAVGDVDIWAFRASNGEPLWLYSRDDSVNDGVREIASDGQSFFIGGRDGLVQRIAPATSNALWRRHLTRADSSLAAYGATLIGPTLFVCGVKFGASEGTGTLFALDASTGAQRWRYDYTAELPGQSSKCYSRVSLSGTAIISAQDDGRIFAHDVATGAVRWIAPRIHTPPSDTANPGTNPYDDRRLVTANAEYVVASSDDGTVVCYSARDGRERWRYKGPGVSLDPPVLVSGMALIVLSGFAISFDLASGAVLWTRPIPDRYLSDPPRYVAQPLVIGDTLILSGWTGMKARLLKTK